MPWRVAEPVSEDVRAQFPDLRPVFLQLLWNRGLRTREAMDAFLRPQWERDAFPPALFRRMGDAVARVFAALERGETIAVHGDYDADGVCGSAVLVSTLRDICRTSGFDERKLSWYLPHRETEGYGLAVPTMEKLATERGATLVITVDCGISNKPAVDRGRELGVDTIVCDHHAMPAALPEAAILIHPQAPGETYPNKHLCGTGVAFKLASALVQEARRRGAALPEGHEKWLLDLVAVATVTDVVPLIGENRALEAYGLIVLNKTRRPGFKALLEAQGAAPGAADTATIGFQIGPRLNAAGRMDHASGALELLLAEDAAEAARLAEALQAANARRQEASDRMYLEALEQVGEIGARTLVVARGDGWPSGLVGLVASKLANAFHRPALVIGGADGRYVGSGRSIPGFDITAMLRAAAEHLDKFGGHPQACGFSITGADRLARAVGAMEAHAEANLSAEQLVPILDVDAELRLEDADGELLADIDRLRPFGEGNRPPVFAVRGLAVSGVDTVGAEGRHLRLAVRSPFGRFFRMIGFRFGDRAATLKLGDRVDVAFELGENEWRGRKEMQYRIVDITPSLPL